MANNVFTVAFNTGQDGIEANRKLFHTLRYTTGKKRVLFGVNKNGFKVYLAIIERDSEGYEELYRYWRVLCYSFKIIPSLKTS